MFEGFNKVADVSTLSRRRWITLLTVTLMGSILIMFAVFPVLIGPLHEKFGWGESGILLVYTLMTWSITPATIIGGKFRDKYGDKPTILISAFLYGLGCIINIFNTNLIVLIISLGICAGSGINIATMAISHNIGVLFPDKRGLATGLFYGGMAIIQALLVPVVSILATSASPAVAFAGLGIVGMIICFFLLPLVLNPPEGYSPNERNVEEAEMEAESTGGLDIDWKKLLKMPSAYMIILAFLLTAINTEALMANVSLIAQQLTGMTEIHAAWMGSLFTLSTGLGAILIGFIVDKMGAFRTAAIIAVLVGVFILIGLITGMSTAIFIAIVAIVGLGLGGSQMFLPVMVMEFGETNFGVNYGIITSEFILTALICPQLTVYLSLEVYFTVGAIGSILAATLYIFAKRSIDRYKIKSGITAK